MFIGEVANWCSRLLPVLASVFVDVAGTCNSMERYPREKRSHEIG